MCHVDAFLYVWRNGGIDETWVRMIFSGMMQRMEDCILCIAYIAFEVCANANKSIAKHMRECNSVGKVF